MAYVYPNYKTKKALKEAVANDEPMTVKDNTPWGTPTITDGRAYLEGPHYPEPHRWYAAITLTDGKITSIK